MIATPANITFNHGIKFRKRHGPNFDIKGSGKVVEFRGKKLKYYIFVDVFGCAPAFSLNDFNSVTFGADQVPTQIVIAIY